MSDNVVNLPTPLQQLAQRYRAAFVRAENSHADWIEATLEMAKVLIEARSRFENDALFRYWLLENELDIHTHQDRAALINMGRYPELTRIVLEETMRTSLRLIWEEEIKPRVTSAGKPPNFLNTSVETHAQPSTAPIQSVSDSPKVTEVSSIGRPNYPISNSKGEPIKDLSKTALAKAFALSVADAEVLLSAYNFTRRGVLSSELLKLHGNHKLRKRAHDLLQLALEVARNGKAPNLSKNAILDARMFWPYLPEAFCKYLDASAPNLARHFDRLELINAKAAEMTARGASAHELHNEINHLWQYGSARPPRVDKPVVIPEHSKIRHEVKFCGERIWPSDSLKATDADLNTGWHLVHHWITYLETARPQKPNEIAVTLAHLIGDIEEATSKEGLVAVMRACLAAFLKINNHAAKADLSNSMAPGLKI